GGRDTDGEIGSGAIPGGRCGSVRPRTSGSAGEVEGTREFAMETQSLMGEGVKTLAATLLAAGALSAQKFDAITGDGWGLGAGSSVCEKPPCYFSVPVLQEGNYRVTVRLGDRESASVTTVKAELRRLRIE